ncbi:kelch domain-containing protein 2-like isoform X1 [Portunus trituberculatus]|nr:kelch domain-containing protein 2-like isoform X1 [Portunus trituberculatus]
MDTSQTRQAPEEYQFVHRRAGHVMVAHNKRLYVWGGYMELPHSRPYTLMTNSKSSYHSAIDVWVFDPLLSTWTRKMSRGDIPQQLSGSCAAVHEDHMYMFGGWANIASDNMENNLNSLWRLHLPTLTWKLLRPEGMPPFPCDKAACWVHNNRFFVFGGFGPAINSSRVEEVIVNFVRDDVYYSGWIDQLVYYDIDNNVWMWPRTKGVKPTPRAAHAADVCGDKVYIFGGRFKNARMNELHCLDLRNWTWSGNLMDDTLQEVPDGRSWHTFKFVSENKAVVYGGFNSSEQVLNDIWLLDIRSRKWCRTPKPRASSRLWHTAAVAHPGEITFYGGIQNNLLDHTRPKDHAEEMLVLRFSPPCLKRLTIEAICETGEELQSQWKVLPQTLQHILAVRLSPDNIS